MTKTYKILIVEDNEMNRDLITRRLQKRGYTVVTAEDGAIGLDTAIREVPDLILMDINLPILDGMEVTRRIKANPQTREIPVIALTAHSRPEEKEDILKSGCDEFESKPIDFERLLRKIQKFLKQDPQN